MILRATVFPSSRCSGVYSYTTNITYRLQHLGHKSFRPRHHSRALHELNAFINNAVSGLPVFLAAGKRNDPYWFFECSALLGFLDECLDVFHPGFLLRLFNFPSFLFFLLSSGNRPGKPSHLKSNSEIPGWGPQVCCIRDTPNLLISFTYSPPRRKRQLCSPSSPAPHDRCIPRTTPWAYAQSCTSLSPRDTETASPHHLQPVACPTCP